MRKKSPKKAAPPAAKRKRPAQAAPRKRRSSEDILNRIVRAATAEFKRDGFTGATTAAIARKADVTEAQLFRYFGSKSNLFREAIFKPLDQLLANFIDRYPRDDSAAHRPVMADLNSYIAEFQNFITEHAVVLTSLLVAKIQDNGDAQGVGEINSLRTYFERSAARLEQSLGNHPKGDPRLMVRISFITVLGSILFRDWIFPPALATEKEIRDAVNNFLMDGLGVEFSGPLPAGNRRGPHTRSRTQLAAGTGTKSR